jgi:hypothetical protein
MLEKTMNTKRQQQEVYNSGIAFSEVLKPSLDSCKYRVMNKDKPAIIIIDGGLGEGKTSAAVQIVKYYQKGKWHSEQVGMGGEEFLRVCDWCKDNDVHVAVYDEAGDLSSRGALTRFNRTMNRFFETYRQYKIIAILCLPVFFNLDKSMFQNKSVQMLINLYGKDVENGDTNFRVYDRMGINWLLYRAKIEKVDQTSIYMRQHPMFRGHILKLPDEDDAKLKSISMKGKKAILNKSVVDLAGLVDIKTIVSRTGYTYQTVSRKMNEQKMKPVKMIGLKKFYDKQSVDSFISGL